MVLQTDSVEVESKPHSDINSGPSNASLLLSGVERPALTLHLRIPDASNMAQVCVGVCNVTVLLMNKEG